MSELSALAGSEGYGACADERVWGFPNKPGKQNDRFPISGKRSFFVFGAQMPSLPVTAKRGLCAQMHCLPVSGTAADRADVRTDALLAGI